MRRSLRSPRMPTERGVHGGRPYLLWLPESEGPWPGMVIVHGAGSRKENHGDFARACAAAGWAAITYDGRGHGEAIDAMSPQAVDDVGRMARHLGSVKGVDESRVCVRGSSMGGFLAIHAAAVSASIAGVIAICPAGEEHLRRGLRDGSLEMRVDEGERPALEAWLSEHDLREAVELLAGKPLLLIHAEGDERIPSAFSQELHARAAAPRKLILLAGGHHRSAQHDAELHGLALRWIERALDGRERVRV